MNHMQSSKLMKAATKATQNQTPRKSSARLTVIKRTTKMTTTTMMAMYSVSGCSSKAWWWAIVDLNWKLFWELMNPGLTPRSLCPSV